jgi:type VI secretion system secreted protein VgrG
VAITALMPIVGASAAQAPVDLGTADSFAVLAGSGITNTGPTTIVGDVGTHPTPTQTGFESVTLTGTNHGDDAVAQQAKSDLTTAYNEAAGRLPVTSVPTELGGSTLTPGVYGGPTLGITGTLTLDTLGDPAAVFIFQASSTLITASSSKVVVLNGGEACNVFWQIGSSATLGTNSTLIGSVLALTSITATTGATVEGRLLAQTGAVTLDSNTITSEACASSATTTTAPGESATTTTAPGESATTTTAPGESATTTTAPGESATTTTTTRPTGLKAPTGPSGSTTAAAGGLTTGPELEVAKDSTTPVALALTGMDRRLPLAGGLTVALGVSLLALSTMRRRQSGA